MAIPRVDTKPLAKELLGEFKTFAGDDLGAGRAAEGIRT